VDCAMVTVSRRDFLLTTSAATLAFAARPGLAAGPRSAAPGSAPQGHKSRVLVASSAPDGILWYDWDAASGELAAAGVAATVPKVAWLAFSHGTDFVYSASELSSFQGKPTGEVASFRLVNGQLEPLTARNSAGVGTCHLAVDRTGQMLVAADYGGGSAASFRISEGRLSEAVWTEHYTLSRRTTASPTSTTWAATASTFTAPVRPRQGWMLPAHTMALVDLGRGRCIFIPTGTRLTA
jgi:6-phosphogluconolactonase